MHMYPKSPNLLLANVFVPHNSHMFAKIQIVGLTLLGLMLCSES